MILKPGPRSRGRDEQGGEICRRCELRWQTGRRAPLFMTKSSFEPGRELSHNVAIGIWVRRCPPWLNSSPRSCSGFRPWRCASSAWWWTGRSRLLRKPSEPSPARPANRPSKARRPVPIGRPWPSAPEPLAGQPSPVTGKPSEPAMRAGFSSLGLCVARGWGVRAAEVHPAPCRSPWDYGCV